MLLSLRRSHAQCFRLLRRADQKLSHFSTCPVLLAKKKKPAAQEEKTLLGRPGNNLKIGIVGVPNVGKSSFFNALSQTDPEEAKVIVPDQRLDWLLNTYKSNKIVPAFLTCIDIAGLTAGASEGLGMGNAFLSHVRAVDGIFQVVRAFDDPEIIHVEGNVDPIRDMEIIQTELRLKDLEWAQKAQVFLSKAGRSLTGVTVDDKTRNEELDTIEQIIDILAVEEKDVRKVLSWSNVQIEVINNLQLLTAKPVTYLVNMSEDDYILNENKWLPKIQSWVDANNPGDLVIPFSVSLEERLAPMSTEQLIAEETEIGAKSALSRITTAGYESLDLIRYFTCGPQEVRAWTIRRGTKAPKAAGVIHTDFERKFICGDIMAYADLVEHGNEAAAKLAGKLKQQGKTYEMVDGDICTWKCG